MHLTLNGKNLEQVETFKYLGVIFHTNLSWKPHMNNLRSKLRISKAVVSRVRQHNQKLLVMLYHTMVFSYVRYCITTWYMET